MDKNGDILLLCFIEKRTSWGWVNNDNVIKTISLKKPLTPSIKLLHAFIYFISLSFTHSQNLSDTVPQSDKQLVMNRPDRSWPNTGLLWLVNLPSLPNWLGSFTPLWKSINVSTGCHSLTSSHLYGHCVCFSVKGGGAVYKHQPASCL